MKAALVALAIMSVGCAVKPKPQDCEILDRKFTPSHSYTALEPQLRWETCIDYDGRVTTRPITRYVQVTRTAPDTWEVLVRPVMPDETVKDYWVPVTKNVYDKVKTIAWTGDEWMAMYEER